MMARVSEGFKGLSTDKLGKNCRMTVLILRKAAETSLKFPDDMLVLTTYEADIEERLKH